MDFIESYIYKCIFPTNIYWDLLRHNTMLCTSESNKKHENMILDLEELTISLEKQDIQNWSYDKGT